MDDFLAEKEVSLARATAARRKRAAQTDTKTAVAKGQTDANVYAAATPASDKKTVPATTATATAATATAADVKTAPATSNSLTALVPSEEQKEILTTYMTGVNIQIEAVAGAGKTTTLLLCAQADTKKRVLILTYNKALQLEVAARVKKCGLNSVTVRTYHSAASASYGAVIMNDTRFIAAVASPPGKVPVFDVLMLDEVQDMAIEYYVFVRYLLAARPEAQWLIVGDPRQAIYQYKGSRVEFLTECDEHFATTDAKHHRPCVTKTLRTTYRLTPSTANFVNKHILKADLLVGGNTRDPDLPPIYVPTGFNNTSKRTCAAVLDAIERYGATNVALIAPSIKSVRRAGTRNPLADLVRIELANVATYVATSDEDIPSDAEIAGKFVIGTFNSMKGRERDCVIVFGLDEQYFTYYERSWGIDRPDVPNILYVATTRARKQMIIIADSRHTLRTVDMKRLHEDANVQEGKLRQELGVSRLKPPDWLSVSDVLQHASSELTWELRKLIMVVGNRQVKPASAKPPPYTIAFARSAAQGGKPATAATATATTATTATTVKDVKGTDNKSAITQRKEADTAVLFENVGILYGIVGPALAEVVKNRISTFCASVHKPVIVKKKDDMLGRYNAFTQEMYNTYPAGFWQDVEEAYNTPATKRPIASWIQMAVAQNAFDSGAHHVARQIRHYDWVDKKHVKEIVQAIVSTLKDTHGCFELTLPLHTIDTSTIHGRSDFCEYADAKAAAEAADNRTATDPPPFKTPTAIWEFKCSLEIQEKHLLQLACYLSLVGAAVIDGKSTGHDNPVIGHCYAVLGGKITSIIVSEPKKFLELALSKYTPPVDPISVKEAIRNFEVKHMQGRKVTDRVDVYGADSSSLDELYD